ncbi:MAG: hypothetical protein P8184_17330 [Calditrichia bacterium]
MSILKKFLSLSIVGVFTFSLLLATGCARHPNQEQISKLEEARTACLSAEQKLSDTQKQRANLETQLAQKKSELDKANAEKAKVQEGLSNWKSEE